MTGAAPAQDSSLWEDAAIANSWDRVVGDYKIFHDVRARGGTVGDLQAILGNDPPRSQTSRDAKPETTRSAVQEGAQGPDGVMTADDEGATVPGEVTGSAASSAPEPAQAPASARTNGRTFAAPASNTPPASVLLPPQTVLGGTDEGLKKLLMSWYYAGYYTGLYEGQQQAIKEQQQQHSELQPSNRVEKAQTGQAEDGVEVDLENGQEMQQ
ncbi:uncharacterized protein SPSK_09166 [Sporothrix schenckii 1099-18]|uniref:Uncharacterized protein n=1 Tax=Sporothrix schenckii 1099-18 TaxID=1397361 RepID=A0A0F2MBL4_SPOSC|nr:uncharacterized protein SPSK_09166 [Sporothrix schenckii 1099-18]KJR85551.1 hypothetical protein SPSK_09166 [Sporothrix schenckii 1099-18]